MTTTSPTIQSVPTNIITGFLGVGKTSTILHLLNSKPHPERWAILVNEFGEVGVDGSLFQGKSHPEQGVFIREVPGGCMCCAAGVPMKVALNQLLTHAKPDRLLIEPTGLGHPKEVLQVLSSKDYSTVLSLQKTLTLVDARNLSDTRYTDNDMFNQQIAVADVIIGNKADLYNSQHTSTLVDYIQQKGRPGTPIHFAQYGEITLSLLEGPAASTHPPVHCHPHQPLKPLAADLTIPKNGFVKATNEGSGFRSTGWRFPADNVFKRETLLGLLPELAVDRMKAVFVTDEGIFGYNLTPDGLSELELEASTESRIEVITHSAYQLNQAHALIDRLPLLCCQ